jgi:hypothetical protein
MPEKVLLMGDADAIKDYVFETPSLPQIRGGSQLLIECEHEARKCVLSGGGEEIFCRGGTFLFEVPYENKDILQHQIESVYLRKTLTATVTVVSEDKVSQALPQPLPNSGWAARLLDARALANADSLAARLGRLTWRLRLAKGKKAVQPFFEALPFSRRCQTCGKRPAVKLEPRRDPKEKGEEPELQALCFVCLRRHQAGNESSKDGIRGSFNLDFRQFVISNGLDLQAKQPSDLDEMAEGMPRKYLAFVYADGNSIGDLMRNVKSKEELANLSRTLAYAVRNALFQALLETCGEALKDAQVWPFEIVNIGGDDVTLIIQAGYAWQVATAFLSHFERLTAPMKALMPEEPGLTASCGIAIANPTYPMRFLEKLAGELLNQAKKLAKAEKRAPSSAISFLWLPNPIVSEEVKPLMDVYHLDNSTELTARPYTLTQAQKLTQLAEQAAHWPRSLRHAWAEALQYGMQAATNFIHYTMARRDKEKWMDFTKWLGALNEATSGNGVASAAIWSVDEKKNCYRTPLLDVLELAELLAMRPGFQPPEEEF